MKNCDLEDVRLRRWGYYSRAVACWAGTGTGTAGRLISLALNLVLAAFTEMSEARTGWSKRKYRYVWLARKQREDLRWRFKNIPNRPISNVWKTPLKIEIEYKFPWIRFASPPHLPTPLSSFSLQYISKFDDTRIRILRKSIWINCGYFATAHVYK